MNIFQAELTLEGSKDIHVRKVFGIIDYIGLLGGSFTIVCAFWRIFVGSHARDIFYVKAVSKLLLIWPYDNKLLKPPNPNPKSQG